ncbi:glycosyltransferase [Diaphorobacter sp.]|uniref:glycosyltransferase n=1 Tax=Diaphorobacter sp. TaxID=1934310 RepID=UPI00258D8F2C|nr:glycosyltransferase [Diaphorobacter sp.]
MQSNKMRAFARMVYHRLPLSQRAKWRLREWLHPVIAALDRSDGVGSFLKKVPKLAQMTDRADLIEGQREPGIERALQRVLDDIARHAAMHGPAFHWIALPFLSAGGAQQVAINLCRALRELRPDESVALLMTDRRIAGAMLQLPDGVCTVTFDDYLGEGASYARKQALLRDLLRAGQPASFHNINSEVAWHLIVAEGEQLACYTRLYASIFAFQFARDGHKKIGYAAYFLERAMPHLAGLLSDNWRFIDDAAQEYGFDDTARARAAVLYQPCRLDPQTEGDWPGVSRLTARKQRLRGAPVPARRAQILWAGRLDEDKRVDLFLDVVRHCTFADFRVFGQVVLDGAAALPQLPNLSYEGPFSSPVEWVARHDFDAFLFTSRWEGMPNVLVEAGAMGIPIIAPTVGGVRELVSEETGYPLPERPTVDDYERAIRRLVGDPLEAVTRAEHMLARVQTRHSWAGFVDALAQVPGYVRPLQPERPAVSDVPLPVGAPLVSVIVPCYNQGRYLQEALTSVLAACRHQLEIIVVDDGSTDVRTQRDLAECEQLAPAVVRVHRQANQGLSGARNSGVALARGQFIQFLDADDVLAPGKIDAQVAQLQINPDLDVSVCNFLLCDESRTDFTKPGEAIAQFDLSLQDFLYRWERGFAIPIHCGLFRRRVFPAVPFDTGARAKEDWLFWTSLAMAGTRFAYIHGHWAIYRQHAASMRRSYVNMGRAWLQAGLKIEAMLGGREPLFFESVVSWFEQCYRAHPEYRQEIAVLQGKGAREVRGEVKTTAPAHDGADPKQLAEKILSAFQAMTADGGAPWISVVVPIYGHYDYLAGCLTSLARQGAVPMEIVCVDDASPDPRVRALMAQLAGRHPRLIVRMQEANAGISATQNLAVMLSRGEFIAFVDCDDALEPNALQSVMACLTELPQVDYLFTDRMDIDERGCPVRVARYGGYETLQFGGQDQIPSDLLDGMVASHLKVVRRSVYLAVGGSDPRWSGVQDWDLALKIAQKHRLHYLDQMLYRHRVHGGSVTRGDSVAQFRKTNQVRRHYIVQWLAQGRQPSLADKIRVFDLERGPVSTRELKACWREGVACIADARGARSAIGFLREFNSYFEAVVWDDPRIPAALYGYLWDSRILMTEAGALPFTAGQTV